MDPEQTFLRVHARLSGMLARLLKPRIRTALEYMSLVVAIALFCLLVVMHVNFVAQPGCSSEFSGTDVTEAHLVQIKINSAGLWAQESLDLNSAESDHQHLSTQSFQLPTVHGDALTFSSSKFWLSLIGTNARKGKGIFKLWRHVKELLELHSRNEADSSDSKLVAEGSEKSVPHECTYTGLPLSAKDSLKAAAVHLSRKWNGHFRTIWRKARDWSCNFCQFWKTAEWHKLLDASTWSHLLQVQGSYLSVVNWLESRSKSYEPTYLYTVEKGYFMLPEGAKSRHNIRTVNISISARNSCFGNRWQQLLVNSFVGYDTILMNSLLTSPGQGYLYNFQTKEFYDLSHLHESAQDSPKSEDYLVSKCGVLMMSLFVFFTTTMSVSFTLRETQSRMLKFTVQLQHHARHRLPTFQLIFIHVIESLVFVPIMIGILFFLFEFYDDQFLAFMVLTLVWLCELFTLISVRTPISMQYYPRFFLLYFLVFHIYFFSYSYGFSYLAFSTMAAFMQHLILYFWNRFEVPALQRFMQQRMQMQQSGVQITSSTIFTSTLHIARLNTANVDPSGQGGRPTADVAGTNPSSDAQNQVRGPDFQSLAFQQAENVPNPTSMNSIGSLLLWVLGGGPSDGFISLFSMFRDLRDQEQAYVPPTEQGN